MLPQRAIFGRLFLQTPLFYRVLYFLLPSLNRSPYPPLPLHYQPPALLTPRTLLLSTLSYPPPLPAVSTPTTKPLSALYRTLSPNPQKPSTTLFTSANTSPAPALLQTLHLSSLSLA